MSSNPPPRRPRRASNGEPSLPIIPILIGVIVLGFVIGAGLSLAGRHDMTVVALASPSAAASETLAPVTPAPTEKPALGPSPVQVTAAPASTAPVAATVSAVVATPRARPVVRASAARAVALAASPAPVAVHPAAVVTEATAAPTVASATPAPVVGDARFATGAGDPNAASSVVEADSAFAKLSAAVVRQYLEAVKRGDQDGAYAALGTTPGAKGATLTEAAVVDSQTRVGRIDAHSAANDNALVSVQLQTANGPYYGQYTVHKTDTGAAVIVAHSIVKP